MRELRPGDFLALTDILRQCGAFNEAELACAQELLEIVLKDPAQSDYRVAVTEEAGCVLGYILFGPVPLTEGNYVIYWIAVAPQRQGRGIGRRLLAHVEALAVAEGARLICLETSSQGSYQRTRDFYTQAGYRLESRIGDFYRVGDDRLTYVKRFTCRGGA